MTRTPASRIASTLLAVGLAFGVTAVSASPASAAPAEPESGAVDVVEPSGGTLWGGTLWGGTLWGGTVD